MTNGTHSPSLTHVILTVLAMLGLVLFILACRPSWSPDSQKVVYSYWDDGSKKGAVALFDRRARTSRVIFEWWDELSSGSHLPVSQWTKDGQRIIVTVYQENGVQLLALPLNAGAPTQAYTLKKMDDEMSPLPYPQAGKNLFLISGKMAVRVNLETGEIFRKEADEELNCLLYDAGDKVFYIKRIRPAKDSHEKKSEDSKTDSNAQSKAEGEIAAYEFGEWDQRDLSSHAWLTLPSQELKAKGIEELSGFADVNAKNLKTAVIETVEQGKRSRVLILGKNGIEHLLAIDTKGKPYELGNPQWSPDGKNIFVAALIELEKDKRTQFAVLEVPLDGSTTRIDPIEERDSKDFADDYLSNVQIALSPDGKFVAATNGHLERVRPERRGLFLLDLSKPDRPVNFYPAPALPVAANAKKE